MKGSDYLQAAIDIAWDPQNSSGARREVALMLVRAIDAASDSNQNFDSNIACCFEKVPADRKCKSECQCDLHKAMHRTVYWSAARCESSSSGDEICDSDGGEQ